VSPNGSDGVSQPSSVDRERRLEDWATRSVACYNAHHVVAIAAHLTPSALTLGQRPAAFWPLMPAAAQKGTFLSDFSGGI
jgi:hypothetical protein